MSLASLLPFLLLLSPDHAAILETDRVMWGEHRLPLLHLLHNS